MSEVKRDFWKYHLYKLKCIKNHIFWTDIGA